jgi:hypothetical protein
MKIAKIIFLDLIINMKFIFFLLILKYIRVDKITTINTVISCVEGYGILLVRTENSLLTKKYFNR